MKGRIIPASILGSTEKVPTHTNPPVYYGAKPSHPPTIQRGELLSSQRCAVEDSLITEEVPTTPQRASDKRTSAALHDTPSFLLKRRSVAESLLDDNSEFSLSLNVSGLNQSGVAHPLPSGREISFHSCSSIAADGTSSLLRDVATSVNFNDISLSGISESGSAVGPAAQSGVGEAHPAAVNDVNPADMSYESLLRWEQAQGGVLDVKWKRVRESVMEVGVRGESEVQKMTVCLVGEFHLNEHDETHSSCCICTDRYDDSDFIRVFPCGHVFHKGLGF